MIVALEKMIAEKIHALDKVGNDTPAVIIVHDLRTSAVIYMSPRGLAILETTQEELTAMGADYHPRFFNIEFAEHYAPKIMGLLERNNNDEIISFAQQVRPHAKADWTWYLSSTKILLRDEQGAPLLIITNAIPLDADMYIDAAKAQRLMEEDSFLRKNKHLFDDLTPREKQILRLLAMGKSSIKIAKELSISEKTATTHRRNIKRKLKAKSNYDITRFAQAFDLV